MELADFEKIIKESNDDKDLKAQLIELAQEHLVNEDYPNGMKINHLSGLKKVEGHIRKFFEPKVDPYAGQGLVKVVGVTVPHVGTGLNGKDNKIKLGDEAILPQEIADQLIAAGQVKEIR